MLPFIAGAAVGAAVVLAFNNKKQIEKSLAKGAVKAKELASQGYEKVKDIASDAKDTIEDKVECLKTKKSTTTTNLEETKND
ncbi:MAG: hypothetical protein RBR23_05670 [Arcobacteraceae bacterium]|jgi:hypothetical protein|nr:hypothetical protein [Arcobacteraceae bacterium]